MRLADLIQPKDLTWIPVETGVNNVEGQTVTVDGGEIQKVLDRDGEVLPFQAHFSHVAVGYPFRSLSESS